MIFFNFHLNIFNQMDTILSISPFPAGKTETFKQYPFFK